MIASAVPIVSAETPPRPHGASEVFSLHQDSDDEYDRIAADSQPSVVDGVYNQTRRLSEVFKFEPAQISGLVSAQPMENGSASTAPDGVARRKSEENDSDADFDSADEDVDSTPAPAPESASKTVAFGRRLSSAEAGRPNSVMLDSEDRDALSEGINAAESRIIFYKARCDKLDTEIRCLRETVEEYESISLRAMDEKASAQDEIHRLNEEIECLSPTSNRSPSNRNIQFHPDRESPDRSAMERDNRELRTNLQAEKEMRRRDIAHLRETITTYEQIMLTMLESPKKAGLKNDQRHADVGPSLKQSKKMAEVDDDDASDTTDTESNISEKQSKSMADGGAFGTKLEMLEAENIMLKNELHRVESINKILKADIQKQMAAEVKENKIIRDEEKNSEEQNEKEDTNGGWNWFGWGGEEVASQPSQPRSPRSPREDLKKKEVMKKKKKELQRLRGEALPAIDEKVRKWSIDGKGLNVTISDDGLKAEFRDMAQKEQMLGHVVSERPLNVHAVHGAYFEVRITKLREKHSSGLSIGFSPALPTSWPRQASQNPPLCWLVGWQGDFWDGSATQDPWGKINFNFAVLQVGDEIAAQITPEGTMKVYVNCVPVCAVFPEQLDVKQPLYAVVNLMGNTDGVELLQRKKPVARGPHS